jgi:cold shock CspA family protein
MRTHGKLIKWNDERGFGFIETGAGREEIFVHISAFPHDGVRPRIGELVSFEPDQGSDGRKRALRVMRPGGQSLARHPRRSSAATTRQSPVAVVAGTCLLATLGWFGYSYVATHHASAVTPSTRATQAPPAATNPLYHCDGRTRCSQMTSCAEATYFIKQCPGTQMDGDGDGVPCESQWCSGSWAD